MNKNYDTFYVSAQVLFNRKEPVFFIRKVTFAPIVIQ